MLLESDILRLFFTGPFLSPRLSVPVSGVDCPSVDPRQLPLLLSNYQLFSLVLASLRAASSTLIRLPVPLPDTARFHVQESFVWFRAKTDSSALAACPHSATTIPCRSVRYLIMVPLITISRPMGPSFAEYINFSLSLSIWKCYEENRIQESILFFFFFSFFFLWGRKELGAKMLVLLKIQARFGYFFYTFRLTYSNGYYQFIWILKEKHFYKTLITPPQYLTKFRHELVLPWSEMFWLKKKQTNWFSNWKATE